MGDPCKVLLCRSNSCLGCWVGFVVRLEFGVRIDDVFFIFEECLCSGTLLIERCATANIFYVYIQPDRLPVSGSRCVAQDMHLCTTLCTIRR